VLAEQVGGSCGLAGSGQEGQDLADGAFPAVGPGERQVGLDLGAVAAAVLALGDVPVWVRSVTMP
jgi:hypothetical protein